MYLLEPMFRKQRVKIKADQLLKILLRHAKNFWIKHSRNFRSNNELNDLFREGLIKTMTKLGDCYFVIRIWSPSNANLDAQDKKTINLAGSLGERRCLYPTLCNWTAFFFLKRISQSVELQSCFFQYFNNYSQQLRNQKMF